MAKKKTTLPMGWDFLNEQVNKTVKSDNYVHGVEGVEKYKDAMDTPVSTRTELQDAVINDMQYQFQLEQQQKALDRVVKDSEREKKFETLDDGAKTLYSDIVQDEDEQQKKLMTSNKPEDVNTNSVEKEKASDRYVDINYELKKLEDLPRTSQARMNKAKKYREDHWFLGAIKQAGTWIDVAANEMITEYITNGLLGNDYIYGMDSAQSKKYKELYAEKKRLEEKPLLNRLKQLQTVKEELRPVLDRAFSEKNANNKQAIQEVFDKYKNPEVRRRMLGMQGNLNLGDDINHELTDYISNKTIDKSIKQITDYLENKDGLISGLANNSWQDVFGRSAYQQVQVALIKQAILNGKEPSELDAKLLEVNAQKQYVENLDLAKDRFIYRTGDGVGYSMIQMAQTAITLPVGGVATKGVQMVANPLAKTIGIAAMSKGIAYGEKVALSKAINYAGQAGVYTLSKVPDVAGVLVQSAVMPNAFKEGATKFIGQTQMVTDENGDTKVLMTKSAREQFLKRADMHKYILESRLKAEYDKEQPNEGLLTELHTQLALIEQEKMSVLDPVKGGVITDITPEQAAFYGYTQNLKEVASERFVGSAVEKLSKPLGKAFSNSKVGKFVSPITRKVGEAWNKGTNLVRVPSKYGGQQLGRLSESLAHHTGGSGRLFHSLPAEIAEEIAVELTPTYMESYSDQLQNLADPMFYVDVMAQTLVMGGAMSSMGYAKHNMKKFTDKDYRKRSNDLAERRRELKELYSILDSEINDEKLSEVIAMSTPYSTFSPLEYEYRIQQLRDEGQTEEADNLQKKSFLSLAYDAIQTNTLDRFTQSINQAMSSEHISPESIKNLNNALLIAEQLDKAISKYSNFVNVDRITDLMVRNDIYERTSNDLRAVRDNHLENAILEIQDLYGGTISFDGRVITPREVMHMYLNDTEDVSDLLINTLDKVGTNSSLYNYLDTNDKIEMYEGFAQENIDELKYQTNIMNQQEIYDAMVAEQISRIVENTTAETHVEDKTVVIENTPQLDTTVLNDIDNNAYANRRIDTVDNNLTVDGIDYNKMSLTEVRDAIKREGKPIQEFITKKYGKNWRKLGSNQLRQGVKEYFQTVGSTVLDEFVVNEINEISRLSENISNKPQVREIDNTKPVDNPTETDYVVNSKHTKAILDHYNKLTQKQLREEVKNEGKSLKDFLSKKYGKTYSTLTVKQLKEGISQFYNSIGNNVIDKSIVTKANEIIRLSQKVADTQEQTKPAETVAEDVKPTETITPQTTEQVQETAAVEDTTKGIEAYPEMPGVTSTADFLDVFNRNATEVGNPQESQSSPTPGNQMTNESDRIRLEEDNLLDEWNNNDDVPFAPRVINRESNDDLKLISSYENLFSKVLAKHPTVNFDGIIANLMSSIGSHNVEVGFNHIAEAWGNVVGTPLSEQEKLDIYQSKFGPIDLRGLINELNGNGSVAENSITPEPQPQPSPDQTLIVEEQKAMEENVVEAVDEITQEPVKQYAGNLITSPSVKIAMLGLDYQEADDSGKYDVSNVINVSAYPVLNRNNFKVGDQVPLTFRWNYLKDVNNSMSIWDNHTSDDVTRRKVSVVEMIESIFGEGSYQSVIAKMDTNEGRAELLSNEDFLKIVPTGFVINNKMIDVGINDYQWWNNRTVALLLDKDGNQLVAQREQVIQEARAYNLATRKAMVASENHTVNMTVKENVDKYQNRLPVIGPNGKTRLNTLTQAFNNKLEAARNNVIIGATVNDGMFNIQVNGKKYLQTNDGKLIGQSQITNLQSFNDYHKKNGSNPSGRVVMLTESGSVNEEGKPNYIINELITNHQDLQEEFSKRTAILDYLQELDNYSNARNSSNGIRLSQYEIDMIPQVEKALNKFGISFKNVSILKWKELYNNNKGKQDFVINRETKGDILDITGYDNVNDFMQDLINGNARTINYNDMLLNSLHTNLVFTDVSENQDSSIWTSQSQPTIAFNNDHLSSEIINEVSETIDTRNEVEIAVDELSNIQKQIDTANNIIATSNNKHIVKNAEKRLELLLEKLQSQQAKLEVEVKEDRETLGTIEVETVNTVQNLNIEFTSNDVNDIINEVLYNALNKIDVTSKFNKIDLYDSIRETFNEVHNNLINSGLVAEAQFMMNNKDSILGNNSYDNSIREYVDTLFELQQDEDFSFENEYVKDYNKESYEMDITSTLNLRVKMLLAGVTDTRTDKKGFAGFKPKMSITDSINGLQQVLSNAQNNTIEHLEKAVKAKIALNPKEFGFLDEVFNRIKELDNKSDFIINEIMYKLYQPKIDMRFIMYSKNTRNGNVVAQNYDANSKNPLILRKRNWKETFKNSPLISKFDEGLYRINEETVPAVKELYEYIKANRSNPEIDLNKVGDFLNYFGIVLNQGTLLKMQNQGFVNPSMSLFNKDKSTGILADRQLIDNLFSSLEKGLVFQKQGKNLSFEAMNVVESNDIHWNLLDSDTKSSIKPLVQADVEMTFQPSASMYVGGKMVNAFQLPKKITNILRKLKFSPEYLQTIQTAPITSENFLTELLSMSNREGLDEVQKSVADDFIKNFKEYFDIVNMSLESIKKRGEKSKDGMEVTDLSDRDAFTTLFNMFGNNDGEIHLPGYENRSLKFRKGIIPFPSLSDSSQMPLLRTILLNIDKHSFENGMIDRLNVDTLNFLTDKLIKGELKRITSFYNNVLKSEEGTTNVKGYDVGAMLITSISSMNALYVPVIDNNGNEIKVPFVEALVSYESSNIDAFLEKHQGLIHDEIQANIEQEVDKFISKDGLTGELVDNELVNDGVLNTIDKQYLDSKDVNGLNLTRVAMYDYVVNNFVTQRDIQTMFAGDIANYFKDKMGKDTDFGLPRVDVKQIAEHYYPSNVNSIIELVDQFKKSNDGPTKSALYNELEANYPHVLNAASLAMTDIDTRLETIQPIVNKKINDMFKDVSNNLSKRLKSLISPGNQFPNSQGNVKYFQVMLQDRESASEVLDYLMKTFYPEADLEAVRKETNRLKELDEIYETHRLDHQAEEYDKLVKSLQKRFPLISGFFKNATTDAQEYATWQDNLEQLKNQNRISKEDYEHIFDKLMAQEKELDETGTISEANRLTIEESKIAVMQPTKPLYSGLHYQDINGHMMSRDIYIKSSSFPLLPEMTMGLPKLNGLRQNLNALQEVDETDRVMKTVVRASYDSANKVGAVKDAISIDELYNSPTDVSVKRVRESAVELDRENFFIQGDKPFKSDKNAEAGQLDMVNRATQFEKILLGDGINKITRAIFPSQFDKDLLDRLGIKEVDGKITGQDLTKIYNEIYRREQAILKSKLMDKFGITSLDQMNENKPSVMEKLAEALSQRLSNKQDKESLELVYTVLVRNADGTRTEKTVTKAELEANNYVAESARFKIPLYMMPNSRKFESVMNSIINKNSINLKMPGYSSPVASQEGFDFKGYEASDLQKQGLITTKNFDPSKGLQATRNEDGTLKHAQVFVANKFKLMNEETGQYEYINLQDYVDENGQIDTELLSPELLTMFSFRIPTSSHQSGVVIEIAGFLPHTAGDLMVVPHDHTTQIGEDYDIDTRYMYQYNYIKDKFGTIRKMKSEDLPMLESEMEKVREDYEMYLNQLYNEVIVSPDQNRQKYWKANQEVVKTVALLEQELTDLQNKKELSSTDINRMNELPALIEQESSKVVNNSNNDADYQVKLEEFRMYKKLLREAFGNEKRDVARAYKRYLKSQEAKNDLLKLEQNNLVDLYKAVFSSTDTEVQSLINKVLSTDHAENTAKEMDRVLNDSNERYNIYSPHTQRSILKLGADGKIGIGEHSNAVTMNSLFQQSEYVHRIIKGVNEEGVNEFYDIPLGQLTFDGIMGKIEVNGVRVSDLAMSDQNSATDNQKLQIMGRRNENPFTMSVLKLLHANGIDRDSATDFSYASLFINQPIIRELAKISSKLNSLTYNSYGESIDDVTSQKMEELFNALPAEFKYMNDTGEVKLNRKKMKELGKSLTSKVLYDNLLESSPEVEYYVLSSFLQFRSAASNYQKLQSFINIERDGLGLSFFDTINKFNTLSELSNDSFGITNAGAMFGHIVKTESAGVFSKVNEDGTVSYSAEIGNGFEFVENEEDYKKGFDELYSETNGYIKVTDDVRIKPNNHYAHKIVNSITTGYYMYKNIFPFDNEIISDINNEVMQSTGLKPGTKRAIEMSYEVMAQMKDYAYSTNKTLFPNGVGAERSRLFFDNNNTGNKSLATYLLELKNNPEYAHIMNNSFFRNLEFDINEGRFPSIVKFSSNDISKLGNLEVHNALKGLINSKEQLPNYNGKIYTADMLIKDLTTYSLIADQANGAIGFRQYIPMEAFDKHGVSESLSKNTNIKNAKIMSMIMNGGLNSISKLLGSKFDVNGNAYNKAGTDTRLVKQMVSIVNKTVRSKFGLDFDPLTFNENTNTVKLDYDVAASRNSGFVRQFFQHNPELVKKLNSKKRGKNTDMFVTKEVANRFISVLETNGTYSLYERRGNLKSEISVYDRINTLGSFGMNEYDAGINVHSSVIARNNVNTVASMNENIAITGVNQGDLLRVLKEIKETNDPVYSNLLEMLDSAYDLSKLKVEVGQSKGNAHFYRGTITVSPEFMKTATVDQFKNTIIEEVIHGVTVESVNKLVSIKGINEEGKLEYQYKVQEPGQAITKLLDYYQQGIDLMIKKHGLENVLSRLKEFNSNEGVIFNDEVEFGNDIYRISNIHEFIASVFIKGDTFGKQLHETEDVKSYIEQLFTNVIEFLMSMIPNRNINSVATGVINEFRNLVYQNAELQGYTKENVGHIGKTATIHDVESTRLLMEAISIFGVETGPKLNQEKQGVQGETNESPSNQPPGNQESPRVDLTDTIEFVIPKDGSVVVALGDLDNTLTSLEQNDEGKYVVNITDNIKNINIDDVIDFIKGNFETMTREGIPMRNANRTKAFEILKNYISEETMRDLLSNNSRGVNNYLLFEQLSFIELLNSPNVTSEVQNLVYSAMRVFNQLATLQNKEVISLNNNNNFTELKDC